jgi:formylglycine-generating enzyme required for sulfatase activity
MSMEDYYKILQYRLPTEAEWEYTCRAGTTGEYAGDQHAMGWYSDNAGGQTHPVGQKQANAWGLYDMHGNVWEWREDWYGSYGSGSETDSVGAPTGASRVTRGGGWSSSPSSCRSAVRNSYAPGRRYDFLGFRLVRTAS